MKEQKCIKIGEELSSIVPYMKNKCELPQFGKAKQTAREFSQGMSVPNINVNAITSAM